MDSKALRGINKICAQCTKGCQQWSQVLIVWCPCFLSRQKKDAKKEGGVPCKLIKKSKMALRWMIVSK